MGDRSEDPTLPGKGARTSVDGPGIQVGDRIRDYVVEELLSTGGFGTVYRVLHTVLGRSAALKVLHAELVSSGDALIRFEREARAVNLIRHRNVVDIYDFGELPNGRPYFVMELLEGDDLETVLNQHGRLAPRKVAELLVPLCSALEAAHQQQIIHRDIKPSNVFVERTKDGERVVLLDFGIAKLLDANTGDLTTTQNAVGSPSSMSPEQIRGGPVDSRTDCYGLGVLAYHLLTGEGPYSGASHTVMQYQHLHAPRPRISTRVALANTFDEFVARAMAVDPSERFPTANELLAAFQTAVTSHEQILESEPPTHRRALAVHVRVQIPPAFLETPDERLIADANRVIAMAAAALSHHEFITAVESSDSAVFVLPLSDNEFEEPEDRRSGIEACLSVYRDLAAREAADDRIKVVIALTTGDAQLTGTIVRGGDVLAPPDYSTPTPLGGVVATEQTMRDVDLPTSALEDVDGFVRVDVP